MNKAGNRPSGHVGQPGMAEGRRSLGMGLLR